MRQVPGELYVDMYQKCIWSIKMVHNVTLLHIMPCNVLRVRRFWLWKTASRTEHMLELRFSLRGIILLAGKTLKYLQRGLQQCISTCAQYDNHQLSYHVILWKQGITTTLIKLKVFPVFLYVMLSMNRHRASWRNSCVGQLGQEHKPGLTRGQFELARTARADYFISSPVRHHVKIKMPHVNSDISCLIIFLPLSVHQ